MFLVNIQGRGVKERGCFFVIVQQLKLEAHKVISIEPSASLKRLLEVLDECGYQHIPVVEDGLYHGMAGYPEVHQAYFESQSDRESFLSGTKVEQIAINKDATIHAEGNIEEIFHAIDRVPFLAVLDEEGRFNGIVLKSTLFNLLRDALGMHQPGVRLTVSMPEMKGYLEKFATVVKNHSNIFGLLVLDDNTNFGYRRVTFKVSPDTDIDALTDDLKHIGTRVFHVTLPQG
jgi:predicted transcriptional regulator